MKVSQFIGFCATVLLAMCCQEKNKTLSVSNAAQPHAIFPLGERITNNNFKGTAYLRTLIAPDSINQTSVGNVRFEPGARTKWHSHPAGQILLVIDGVGYYQEKGQPKRILREGEALKCPPNVPHWHGASSDAAFVQVAITGRQNGETVWLEEVTDEEYNSQANSQ